MRRVICLFSLLLAAPLQAETLQAGSKITAVTVYPEGAMLTRRVEFDAPAGLHDLLITDLPQYTDPQTLRLTAAAAVQIGAYALRTDRLPPRPDLAPSAEYTAAKTALEAAQDAETTAQLALDAVTARIEAAQAQIAYLGRLGASDAKADTEMLQATARMIGAEVLAASQTAIAARADLPAAQRALRDAQEARAKAEAALQALTAPRDDYAALSLAISVETPGPATIEINQFMPAATWSPLYDIALTRQTGKLVLDRSLLVSQSTGEDWEGVALTLSTAQPGNLASPSELWPQLHRIDDPQSFETERSLEAGALAPVAAEPMVVSDAFAKTTVAFQGDTVTYTYPQPVDIADGVTNLRLSLDQLVFDADARARAIPRADATAFLMAEFRNSSGQILLPGPAFLTRDGAFIGGTMLEPLAPEAVATLGFGAIEGLRLKRTLPSRAEGDRGVFTKSNQIVEEARLSIENLTAEDWPVRVMDTIPYSEQEDLQITFTATPPVSEQDVDGRRGVLAWDLTVPAQSTQVISLTTQESWPEGKVLNGGRY